tara:strand:+ start:373 stop:1698 length:1326 start_codon:yes stop_codon:yes gene_type:complete
MSSANRQVPGTGNGRMNFKIFPSNASASNVFTSSSSPVLSFQIPNADVLLDLQSLRICGNLKYKGITDPAGATVRMDQYCGVSSLFSTVTWSSLVSRSVIEQVQYYGQMVNAIVPQLQTTADFQNSECSGNLSTQELLYQRNQFNLAAVTAGVGVNFATKIYTGLTLGSDTRLPLSKIGGLNLSINLSSNEAYFLNSAAADSPTWELSNMSLEGDYYVPQAAERETLMGMKEGSLTLNTMTSLFNVLQSSDHVSNFQLGLRDVVSAFYVSKPASWVNNYNANEYQHIRIQNTAGATQQQVKVNWLMNGSQAPLNFPLDVVTDSNEGQCQQLMMMGLKRIQDMNELSISNDTNDPRVSIGSTGFASTSGPGSNQALALNKCNYVNAIAYDVLGDGSGANFQQSPLTFTIKSDLSDGEVQGLYIFILNATVIEYNEMGINVIN